MIPAHTAIGIVGLGRMGSAMAQRLTENGFAVVGWDASAAAVAAFAASGGSVASHPRGVAESAGIVMTSVTDDAAVREIFGGANGFLAAPLDAKLFVEMSTLRPETVRALESQIAAGGGAIVDAPLLGTIPNARAGTLTALVGGAAADIDRAQAVFEVLAQRVARMGKLGSGHAMKLAVNLGLAAYVQGLAESLALGESEGLDLTQMLDVLAAAPTANAWLGARRKVVTGDAHDVTLDIRTMRKDVTSALATGTAAGLAMPLAAGTLAAFSAAVDAGLGDRDLGEIAARRSPR